MHPDGPSSSPALVRNGLRAPAVGLLTAVLAACSLGGARPAAPAPITAPTAAPVALADDPSPACVALAFQDTLRRLGTAELQRERAALANPPSTPLQQIQRALLLGQSRNGDLSHALVLVDAVLASSTPEAVQLHPLAQLLAEQFAERQRLEAVAERLTRQLERTGQQLKDSQRRSEELQEKLDALAEIEGKLPARPPAPPLPELPDRRNP